MAKAFNEQLADDLTQLCFNPLGYVHYNFDWGQGALSHSDGPDEWQRDVLLTLGEELKKPGASRIAVKSGHGPGKTALISWIVKHFIATRPNPQVVVTANTSTQLETKTWRELNKWNNLGIDQELFEWTATKFYYKGSPGTWFAAAIPWSKERAEAFAGTHEQFVLVVFDEASLIDDVIWEVTEGAMTDTTGKAVWLVFGNPTKNTGRFRDCFGRLGHRWIQKTVDSRTAKMADKKLIGQWIEDYGEDSDFVRVRVKGEFPRSSVQQFIPEHLVDSAFDVSLTHDMYSWAPVIMGVDVARFGDDSCVICVRQGLKTHEFYSYREVDTMSFAGHVAQKIKDWHPQSVFVDVGAMGAGVIDRLRQLGFDNIVEVNFGEKAQKWDEYADKRAEMWGGVKDWLIAGGSLPDETRLKQELTAPEYFFDNKSRLRLEKKEDVKKRLGTGLEGESASPDMADALALTFALPVLRDEPRRILTPAEKDWLLVTGQDVNSSLSFNLE